MAVGAHDDEIDLVALDMGGDDLVGLALFQPRLAS